MNRFESQNKNISCITLVFAVVLETFEISKYFSNLIDKKGIH